MHLMLDKTHRYNVRNPAWVRRLFPASERWQKKGRFYTKWALGNSHLFNAIFTRLCWLGKYIRPYLRAKMTWALNLKVRQGGWVVVDEEREEEFELEDSDETQGDRIKWAQCGSVHGATTPAPSQLEIKRNANWGEDVNHWCIKNKERGKLAKSSRTSPFASAKTKTK